MSEGWNETERNLVRSANNNQFFTRVAMTFETAGDGSIITGSVAGVNGLYLGSEIIGDGVTPPDAVSLTVKNTGAIDLLGGLGKNKTPGVFVTPPAGPVPFMGTLSIDIDDNSVASAKGTIIHWFA